MAILDADKEGFLRSYRSLMQVAGRAARNVNGRVIFYADKITDSMKSVIDESNRRRRVQEEYNRKHNIEPKTITKTIEQIMQTTSVADVYSEKIRVARDREEIYRRKLDDQELIELLRKEMLKAADNLEFEKAAKIRDEIIELEKKVKA